VPKACLFLVGHAAHAVRFNLTARLRLMHPLKMEPLASWASWPIVCSTRYSRTSRDLWENMPNSSSFRSRDSPPVHGGDIFTLPLGGDRIMELRHDFLLCVLCGKTLVRHETRLPDLQETDGLAEEPGIPVLLRALPPAGPRRVVGREIRGHRADFRRRGNSRNGPAGFAHRHTKQR